VSFVVDQALIFLNEPTTSITDIGTITFASWVTMVISSHIHKWEDVFMRIVILETVGITIV
jgi:hypothetical protein